jgi:N-acetylglucosamine-6-phosphate deacetylase
MLEAAEHGYTHMTHLYSGMDSVVRVDGIRIAGAVEAAYLHDGITVEIITDGMHLPHELLLLVYKFNGAERTALITDAMRGAGSYDGQTSILGSLKRGQEVFIEDGVAWMPHRQAFAGSIATFDRLVRTMLEAGVPLLEVIRMASETPAKIIGCHRKGTLDVGKDADIVLFDDNIWVVRTIVRGKTVFSK